MESELESPPSVSPARATVVSGSLGLRAPNPFETLAQLLEESHPLTSATTSVVAGEQDFQNELAQVRLGLAASLFFAMRAKHPPTARHSLRVAIGCSSWSMLLQLPTRERDEIEVAALLHDVGKIGVPDDILMKPGKLNEEECVIMDAHRQTGLEILRGCMASDRILEIVAHCGSWFQGSADGLDTSARYGHAIPLGARMISILDAFDAMTTDHVYRRAMSQERAMAELFEFAGRQFDPQLVNSFHEFTKLDANRVSQLAVRRWLTDLDSESSNSFFRSTSPKVVTARNESFSERLIENLTDAVIMIDQSLKICGWNRAAERLTGIAAQGVLDRKWHPTVIGLRNMDGVPYALEFCPFVTALHSNTHSFTRLCVRGPNRKEVHVNAHLGPIVEHGKLLGASMVLHDASAQLELEQDVTELQKRATCDPLTGVSNRAEFDDRLVEFVDSHLASGTPFSLIISDIDNFKRINDQYGHQAGDEALISFANLLKRSSRTGDIVARYGGEEFVLLCPGCDNSAAAAHAEEIRSALCSLPQASLGGSCITASFGVTEIQNGDTPETMLRRADRGLLQAKDNGRNQVVQLGVGIVGGENHAKNAASGWFSWIQGPAPKCMFIRDLVTSVPLNVSVEKLRGFVADHRAEIVSIKQSHVVLQIDSVPSANMRRADDRMAPFIIELDFTETNEATFGRAANGPAKTKVAVSIHPKRDRDRRRRDAMELARKIFISLKSYLVASEQG